MQPAQRVREEADDGDTVRLGPASVRTASTFSTKATVIREDDETFIEVPVSSIVEDRDGDTISEQGLKDMVDQIQSDGIPLFLNHGLDENGLHTYRVEDMAGEWVDAEIREGIVHARARGEPGNEDFLEVAEKVENGLPVGFSIGFFPQEFEEKSDPDEFGRVLHKVDLVEISPVGIPSNPAAVARQALKAANLAGVDVNEIVRDLQTRTTMQGNETDGEPDKDSPDQEPDRDDPDTDGEPDPEARDPEMRQEEINELAEALAEELEPRLVSAIEDTLASDDNGDDEDEEGDEEQNAPDADPDTDDTDEDPDTDDPEGPDQDDPDEEPETQDPQGIRTLNDRDEDPDLTTPDADDGDAGKGSGSGLTVPAFSGGADE